MTTRHNRYEVLFIHSASGTEEDVSRMAAKLEEPIKRLGGTPENRQSLGRRRLAFKIAKQHEGYYHMLRFSAPTERLAELERLYRLNEAIIRFMILSADHAGEPQAQPKAEPVARPARSVTNG